MPPTFIRWATAYRLLLLGSLLTSATRPAAAQTAYGLIQGNTSQVRYNLVKFNVATPGTYTSVVPITGLSSLNEILVGLDVRPTTGELFALDYLPASSQARLYKINPATGALTAVGPAFPLALGTSSSNYNYTNDVGFDFDPTTDRIRVTTVNRTNYRLNPNTGALDATDGTLTYASTDPNASQVPGVGASAYTNSYLGATTTTLYNLDEPNNRLVTQTPANSGTLHTIGTLCSVYGTLINGPYNESVGMDIYYNPATNTNVGYVSHLVSGSIAATSFYSLDLATGILAYVGEFGTTSPGNNQRIVLNIAIIPAAVALPTRPTELATDLALFPNPASSSLSFSFSLPHAARAELVVTDLLGHLVSTLDAEVLLAGPQVVRWQRGSQAAGVYLVGLRLDGQPAGTCRAVLTD